MMVINASLGAIFFGYVMGIFNVASDFLTIVVFPGISDTLLYLITSAIPLGAGLGAWTAGSLASKYGRRNAMIITDLITIIAVGLKFVNNEYALLVGRLICGYCVGLNSTLVPLYIAEVSPTPIKGVTGTFNQLFFSVGLIVAYSFGYLLP